MLKTNISTTAKHFQIYLKQYLLLIFCLTMTACATTDNADSGANIQTIGKAKYRTEPLARDTKVPDAPYRTAAIKNMAAPTNQWYSSVMFTKWSEVIHALPLTFKASIHGLEMGLPVKNIVPTERQDVEVFYPHVADLIFAPKDFTPEVANLAGFGDWHAVVSFDDAQSQSLSATVAHGSPFVYMQLSSGDLQVSMTKALQAKVSDLDKKILLVTGKNKTYAVFAPMGGIWQQSQNQKQANTNTKPTYGVSDTLVIYDGRLDKKLSWKSYNPEAQITIADSDGESVFFEDRLDEERKFLNINKTGKNGNVYTVYGQPDTGERADLSYWSEQGELVMDIRINSADEGVGFLVKIDSGWPNVSDYEIPLPQKGEWTTVRIPMHELIANGNRFNPGAYTAIHRVENLVVLEPTGVMNVDIDNIRLEINTNIQTTSSGSWVLKMPKDTTYISAAVLPNSNVDTLKTYFKSAYTHIENTQVAWNYDKQNSVVTTQFTVATRHFDNNKAPTIMGLYPHQYIHNSNIKGAEIGTLASIRGAIKLYPFDEFTLTQRYKGFVPYWPVTNNEDERDELETQLSRDVSRARAMIIENGWGAYWQGKGLQRISQLMNVAHVMGEESSKERLLELLQERMDEWFSTEDANWYFHYDDNLGTVVAYPEEYDAVKNINDHHFHYGYWIRAAAEIAMQDPEWAKEENYGAMINLLVSEIATSTRGGKKFPFLRNFDPYESHSWAGGTSMSPDGNNQESSSEAVNAWAGLILWGTVTGNTELVDLGVYLYTSEILAVQYYWFDLYNVSFPPEYTNKDVSIVFGGRLTHNTWWTDEPRQIHGINLLPLTPSSIYLAEKPAYIQQNLAALDAEMKVYAQRGKVAKPADIWQDLFAKYLALADPEAGLARWDLYGSFELGDTRSHAYHWLTSLKDFGVPDLSVSANTTLYAVFTQKGKKTYMVFNAQAQPLAVQFSDGTEMTAQPYKLTVKTGNTLHSM